MLSPKIHKNHMFPSKCIQPPCMNIAAKTEADRKALSFAMSLSLVIGLLMFVMKVGAYLLTGSAAILSDAADGRVTIRRLNRSEYNNTIRDLVGVNIKPAEDFPADDVGYGFDNIGDALSVEQFEALL